MRPTKPAVALACSLIAVLTFGVGAAVGAGFDNSSPSSTGCVKKGPVEHAGTSRTFGPWQIRLRRSTGCNTVWAVVTRIDGKRCKEGGVNCAQVRVTRVLGTGTRVTTPGRRQPDGTKAVASLQLVGKAPALFLARFSTFSGKNLGTSGTLSVDAAGKWTAA